jgi:hypothetical protein
MHRNLLFALALAGAALLASCGGSAGGGGVDDATTLSRLTALKDRSIYLGHQSVGANIMQGVDDYLAQLAPADRMARGGLDAAGPGHWVDGYIGSNGDPLGKISAFQANVLAHCGDLEVAMMKFCWADTPYIDSHSAQDLLDAYVAMVDTVEAGCPGVNLVHFTIPLMTSGNTSREAYNALLRTRYGSAVFDLAAAESTLSDGSRSTSGGVPVLYSGYASDSGHLNATGRAWVAAKLITKLAASLP